MKVIVICKRIWRLFGSVRLAVILILIIACLSLIGALLIQVPAEMAGDPELYSYWVDTVANNKVGMWAPLLSALDLFDIFRSPWFFIAGVLLMLNIIVCSINRWKEIKLSIRGGAIKHNQEFYSASDSFIELERIPLTSDKTTSITDDVLHINKYRIRKENDSENVYIAADKNRYFRLGTYFSHLSLILFILAFLAGNYYGFNNTRFSVPVGDIREIGYGTELSLELISFEDEYYENGMPKDYRSHAILYKNDQPVKESIIRVNYPLVYGDLSIYQSYFGGSVRILARNESGDIVFNDYVLLNGTFYAQGYQYNEGYFQLPDSGTIVRVISTESDAEDVIIPPGNIIIDTRVGNEQIDMKLVSLDNPRLVGDYEFVYQEKIRYSGFQVRKDPANALVWIASTLFIIGIRGTLYFPYRQVWIRLKSTSPSTTDILIRTRSRVGFSTRSELDEITDKLKSRLPEIH